MDKTYVRQSGARTDATRLVCKGYRVRSPSAPIGENVQPSVRANTTVVLRLNGRADAADATTRRRHER
jgi:hypothetical protein